jgi:hypothetical protein
MHEHEKTQPIMYMCQFIFNKMSATRIIIIKFFSTIFEIFNCFFYDTFFATAAPIAGSPIGPPTYP